MAISKVEAAFKGEREIKEAIEEELESLSLYHLKDTLDATEEAADENRLLPTANKIWPFLVTCIQNRNPVVSNPSLMFISCFKIRFQHLSEIKKYLKNTY